MANESFGRSGLRLLVEGVVVLVSILIAFFLEGWGSDRELALELDQELVSVRRELGRNRELVEAELVAIDRVLSGTEHLLDRLTGDESADQVAVRDSVAWLATIFSPTLDPSLGAVEALITSGRLARIESPELRLGLAGLKDMFTDASEEERLARQLTFEQLFPLVTERMDLAMIRRVSSEFVQAGLVAGTARQEQMADRQMPTYDVVQYPNELVIRGVLHLKLVWYVAAVAELRPLLEHLDILIGLVSEEIE